jgi:hypothetical protein
MLTLGLDTHQPKIPFEVTFPVPKIERGIVKDQAISSSSNGPTCRDHYFSGDRASEGVCGLYPHIQRLQSSVPLDGEGGLPILKFGTNKLRP